MNSKSNRDSAFKCFVFFLISQPLIYLCEVPFKEMGWGLFNYYSYWLMWTFICLPMAYIGYYMKKDKWYSLIILIPMLLLLGFGLYNTIINIKYSFPKHIIYTIFITLSLIIYPLTLFNNKIIKYIGLSISIIIILIFGTISINTQSTYETSLCTFNINETDKVYLEDSNYGNLSTEYIDSIKSYCIHASFKKPGNTKIIIETKDNIKKEFRITIGKMTYDINDEDLEKEGL